MLLHRSIRKLASITGSLWSRFNFQAGGGKLGRNSVLASGFYTNCARNIIIGDNCYLGRGVKLVTEIPRATLLIEDNVKINDRVFIDFSGDLIIRSGTLISDEAMIYTHSHGYDPRSEPHTSALCIEQNSWIGIRSLVLSGCSKIGPMSISAAGALVTKSIVEGDIVAGVPAKSIKRNPRCKEARQ